jgi:predicted Zn-dependent protease
LWLAALAAAAAAFLAGLAACAPPPPPPREPEKPEVILRTEADDRRAGAEAAAEVATQIGLIDDLALSEYVDRVGQRLALQAPGGDFSYKFAIVDQDSPNAFALPGGYIFVSRGLLALSNSEDELANVLGHEIVHVARRHASARQSFLDALPVIFQFVAMQQVAAYGREQEREADRLGQGLAALAGYDPHGLASFLTGMEYLERLRLGFSRMPGFLDTHPTSAERVAANAARADSIHWERRPGIAPAAADYVRRLDGIVVGTAASEGAVQGDRFLHPDLGFSMRFPAGWSILNTKQAVGALSPRHDAQVVLEFQGRGDDPEQASAEFIAKAEQEGLRVESLQRVKLGTFDAVRATGTATTPLAPLSVHLTWIAREGTIYRISGVALGSGGSREGVFHSVARSFRPITPAERRAVRETRIHVVEAAAGETLSDLSRRTDNVWDLQQTAVMNGVYADHRFDAPRPVKVAVSRAYE